MFSSKTFDQPHLISSSKYCIEEAGDMTVKSFSVLACPDK